jgi:hypothetical protein
VNVEFHAVPGLTINNSVRGYFLVGIEYRLDVFSIRSVDTNIGIVVGDSDFWRPVGLKFLCQATTGEDGDNRERRATRVDSRNIPHLPTD